MMGVIHVRVRGDRCGNEDGNLEMAIFLVAWHFQQVTWK